ncbi:MAG: 50S ribosomal protein L18Ae [Salinirussus sp.]
MTEYTVSGRWERPDGWQSFETTVTAPNEEVAVEHAYATVGSRHGLKRRSIDIEEVHAT